MTPVTDNTNYALWAIVSSAYFAGLAIFWKIIAYFDTKSRYLKEKKSEYYQRVISAEEEMHESIFKREGDGKRLVRNRNWKTSKRYLDGATQMNWCLAGISLYGTSEIIINCANLENVAQMSTGDPEREKEMNKLINLMRDDLKTNTRYFGLFYKEEIRQSWI